jgi:replication fork protection complex subunit Csm3/Swi3
MYQLWLDDLYPRAKFADALLMIEKLGHSKTMQMLRKQWIDEGKPKPPVEDYDPPSDMDEIAAEDRPMTDDGPPDPPEAEEGREHGTRDRRDSDSTNNASDTVQTTAASHSGEATEMDEMDELDALLAEQEAASGDHVEPGQAGKNQGTATQAIPGEDDFADEMEAMEGMDVPW